MLLKRGIRPESLPPAEDIKKVQRKLEKEDKKMLKNVKKKGLKTSKIKIKFVSIAGVYFSCKGILDN